MIRLRLAARENHPVEVIIPSLQTGALDLAQPAVRVHGAQPPNGAVVVADAGRGRVREVHLHRALGVGCVRDDDHADAAHDRVAEAPVPRCPRWALHVGRVRLVLLRALGGGALESHELLHVVLPVERDGLRLEVDPPDARQVQALRAVDGVVGAHGHRWLRRERPLQHLVDGVGLEGARRLRQEQGHEDERAPCQKDRHQTATHPPASGRRTAAGHLLLRGQP
mmetsp:Transcript_14703/g.41623  ORF Transcript_14703/g.41623 Transcript_14703/m.41623 type:complete len:224 (-) Transcript_14703:518-1189(-)